MAISYPLNMPSSPEFRNIRISAVNTVSESRSPFSGVSQTQAHTGSWWEFDVELPPMTRANAEAWLAFLVSLKGLTGTFYIGDPDGETARGIATGTPLVNGADQTGGTLITDGWTASQTGILKAGDYIQIGDYMYKILQDADSDGSGNATFDIWPNLRSSPANDAAITVSSCVTRCRLVSNITGWSANDLRHYGISFVCREAL